jgi:hypothetical protein
VFSIATLLALYYLIVHSGIITSRRAQTYSLLLACFAPQFVLFSLYVSNDTLAILMGSLAAIAIWKYIQNPTWRSLILLAITTGAGLSTKTSFVVLIPIVVFLACWYPSGKEPGWNPAIRTYALVTIMTLLGGFKFADNLMRYGNPFFTNMDLGADWSQDQEKTYRGLESFLNVNVGRLIVSPIVGEATTSAYPVLLYGTFWYPHIPDGSFSHGAKGSLRYVGSAVFLLALLPSVLFFAGLGKLLYGLPRVMRSFDASQQEDRRELAQCLFALTIAIGTLLLNAVAIEHHVWSIFQGRLLFPWFFGGAVAFSEGNDMLMKGPRRPIWMATSMVALVSLFLVFFGSELAWAARHVTPPAATESDI